VSWFRRAFDALEARRARRIARRLRHHLSAGERVLDLGCGSLMVAEAVRDHSGVRVVGIDTLAFPKRPLPMTRCSGARAPFGDGAFDAVILCFVLHHCEDGGLGVLAEAKRLARKRILVLEDGFDTLFERVTIRAVDRILNFLENPRIPVPYRFRPTEDWKRLFESMGLRLRAMDSIRTTPILETRQVLFVLEPY